MPILKLDPNKDTSQEELEFEVKCELEYTTPEQRIHNLLELNLRMLHLAKKYEDRKPYQIIKRPAG